MDNEVDRVCATVTMALGTVNNVCSIKHNSDVMQLKKKISC